MIFACQVDSFQRSLVSKVISCTPGDDGFYEVVCEDTILFPEGGGQPSDKGFINGIPVERVLRRSDEAVLYVKEPLEIGQEVTQEVDWERRLDHMQQHSGQHLITAVINETYQFDTTSWALGEKVCRIELNTPELTEEQIQNIEKIANRKIEEEIPVNVKLYELGDKALENARTRGLPDDVKGPIRVVEIVGLEEDLCCGTHVKNLIQLRSVKLLYAEKGKKNKTNLYFLCGGRILKYLTECLKREEGLTKLLEGESAGHVSMVAKLLQNVRKANKKLMTAHRELAVHEATRVLQANPRPMYFSHHNKDAGSDYIEQFLRTLKKDPEVTQTLFMLATGEDGADGCLVVHGDPEVVKDIGPKLAEILVGKGAVHGPKFQAKVSKLSNFSKAQELIKEYYKNMSVERS